MIIRKFKFGGLVYDLSIMQIDKEIGIFFDYLKKEKIIENTNLIITSDHGLKAGFLKDQNLELELIYRGSFMMNF